MADRVKSRAVWQCAQVNLTDFSGSIEIQASMDIASSVDPEKWYLVGTFFPYAYTGNQYATFQGKFNLIRFKIIQDQFNQGTVNYILYRP